MPATVRGKAFALRQLQKRRDNQPKQIDNASLYAGSPMYFYCVSCGAPSDIKSENYLTPPKKLCPECQAMKDAGWLE